MKIKRIIDGKEYEFELTNDEIYEAHRQFRFDWIICVIEEDFVKEVFSGDRADVAERAYDIYCDREGVTEYEAIGMAVQEYVDGYEELADYDLIGGFNTKQWWVYSNSDDVYIDPPTEFLEKMPSIEEGLTSEVENLFYKLLRDDHDWLFDEDYRYDADDIEI